MYENIRAPPPPPPPPDGAATAFGVNLHLFLLQKNNLSLVNIKHFYLLLL